jgi:hypothetical protein
MSDIIRDAAAHQWRQRCQAAFYELDPIKLLERISEARSAVLGRIADHSDCPSPEEACALRSALETLAILLELAERDLGEPEQKKTVQTLLAADYARYHKRESAG